MRKTKRKAKSDKTITVKVPVQKTVVLPDDVDHIKFGKMTMFQNDRGVPDHGMFFLNPYNGQKIDKEGFITLVDHSRVMFGIIRPDGGSRFNFEVSIPELKKLVKEAEKREKKFKNGYFPGLCFINLSPDVGMMVRLRTPKKAKKHESKRTNRASSKS